MAAPTRIAVMGVVAVLGVALLVFALRSWVGLDPASDTAGPTGGTPSAAGEASSGTPTPSPSATTPSPSASASPSTTPSPSRTTAPRRGAGSSSMSTDGVENAIGSRTAAVAGRPTSVLCPDRVSAATGTTFRCTVAYASEPASPVADATVRITGPGGRFAWQSRSRG